MDRHYKELLYVIDDWFQKDFIIMQWGNGLKIKCRSFTGICETDTEPGDEDYIGEYSAGVNEIEVIEKGRDDSIESYIYDHSMEISLKTVPEKIMLEDGTMLWEKEG